jgi:hypothetical protein
VKFTGTNLKWIGVKGTNFGIAKITIDGTTTQTVDLYNASSVVTTVWTSPTLANGAHTIKIQCTGTKNTKSTATYIGVDAFDVTGTLQ